MILWLHSFQLGELQHLHEWGWTCWLIHVESLAIHKIQDYIELPVQYKLGDVSDCFSDVADCRRRVMFVSKSCHLRFQATAVKYVKTINSLHIKLLDSAASLGFRVVESLGSLYHKWQCLCAMCNLLKLVWSESVGPPSTSFHVFLRIWLELLDPGAVDSVDSFAVASVTTKLAGRQVLKRENYQLLTYCSDFSTFQRSPISPTDTTT